MSKGRRKKIPLHVKLEACLILLGFGPDDEIDWDHFPALGLRKWIEEVGDFEPPQLDPNYIRPMRRGAHKRKTGGRRGEKRVTSYGSDVHAIAKLNRLEPQQAAFRERMLRKAPGQKQPSQSKWPKGRKLRGRRFASRRLSA